MVLNYVNVMLGEKYLKFMKRQHWQTIFAFKSYLFLRLKKTGDELVLILPKAHTFADEMWTFYILAAFKTKNVS